MPPETDDSFWRLGAGVGEAVAAAAGAAGRGPGGGKFLGGPAGRPGIGLPGAAAPGLANEGGGLTPGGVARGGPAGRVGTGLGPAPGGVAGRAATGTGRGEPPADGAGGFGAFSSVEGAGEDGLSSAVASCSDDSSVDADGLAAPPDSPRLSFNPFGCAAGGAEEAGSSFPSVLAGSDGLESLREMFFSFSSSFSMSWLNV